MATYDVDDVINFVSYLMSKGLIVKLNEVFDDEHNGQRVQETMFKQKNGLVFAKGRNCIPKPEQDTEGWELHPLEFEDWWVDIIVDGFLSKITIIRYGNQEHCVWSVAQGFAKSGCFIPPSTIKIGSRQQGAVSLKELSILALRDLHGFAVVEELEYALDKETLQAAKASMVWWQSL